MGCCTQELGKISSFTDVIVKILEVASYENLKQQQGSAVRVIQTPLGRFKLI